MLLVDIAIILTLLLYGWYGFKRGFITQLADLIIFLISFLTALAAYHPLGTLLKNSTPVPAGISDLLGFMVLWLGLDVLLSFGWKRIRGRVPLDLQNLLANRVGGIIPGLLRGLALLVVLLLIVASAPLPTSSKEPILSATLSKPLLGFGTGLQQKFNQVFGSALQDTLAFKTIKTESDESVELGFQTSKGTVCESSERRMLQLVNQERRKFNLGTVRQDDALRNVGRAHSRDMLERGYFSHVNPDGLDPFDRMERARITYTYAGENLAFAPTTEIAHTGLMNSPGHRANILKREFTRLGVGCIDAGFRGKMFSQEFAG